MLPDPSLPLPSWLVGHRPAPPSPRAAAAAILMAREKAMSSLAEFARRYVGVEPALHHRLICDAVDDLLADRYDVLVVMSPPASAKSTYISVAAPAYIISRDPTCRLISVSRAAELAAEFGGRVKNIVEGEDLQKASDTRIAHDTRAKDNWKTTEGGGYFAVGASGGVLGKRADIVICLPASAQVRTKFGYTSISNIKVGDEVEAYDREKLSTGYHRVTDTGWRETDDIYRIHTADGRVVEATGNHPFFVGGRFVQAMALAVGDILLSSVRYPDHPQRDGDGQVVEEGEDAVLLRSSLRDDPHERPAGVQDASDVQRLWEGIHLEGTRRARCAGLLGGVSDGDASESRSEATQEHGGNPLCSLRDSVPEEVEGEHLLLAGVQEHGTPAAHERIGKSGVSPREVAHTLSERRRHDLQIRAENGDVPGQSGMRDLHQHGESAWTPCGHEQVQQRADQYRNVMPDVSSDSAWCRPGETFETTVARIERVRRNEKVWDIKVEGVANFFANGILVHNCDDIHASFEDAQSMTQLEKIHSWFESDLLSRLTPTGKLVVIGQRLNANDIIGFTLRRAAENPSIRLKLLKFTAECADPEDDPLHRQLGERMWPEFYTDKYLHDKKRDAFIWKTLWMQEPPSEEGSWVNTDEIGFRPSPVITPDLPVYGATDLALSVNTGDYTVHGLIAINQLGEWDIVHCERARTDTNTSAGRIISLTQTFQPREWLIDDDNASKVFVNDVAARSRASQTPVPWKPMPMRGQDKETRAAALRGQFKRRRVFMPADAPWTHWLVKELLVFPNATGSGVDDGVDMLGLFGRRLTSLARPAATAVQSRRPTTSEMTLDGLWDTVPKQSMRI